MPEKSEAEAKSDRAKVAASTIVYFNLLDGSYLYPMGERFVSLKKTEIFTQLTTLGLTRTDWLDAKAGRLDCFEWVLWKSREENMIDYAGALAGHQCGIFTDGSGRKYLVTDEAAGVFDKLGKDPEPEFFQEFLKELLPGDQCVMFCHWLAISLRSLRNGDMRPGQAVVLAGPASCGKSLAQSIVTEIFGGRAANPFRYMMELTPFNKDLAGAEHWQIEDPSTTTDIRSRRNFGAKLKEATVNRDFSIHAKTKDALTLPIFRRVTISVNDEPENLAIIPPLEASMDDKLFLFHCAPASKCFDPFRSKNGDLDRAAVWAHVREEIPAIRAWLLRAFTRVPKGMQDDRFGIKAWHHPELREELMGLSPETRFLQLIDDVLFTAKEAGEVFTPFNGKSSDLEKELRKSEVAFEVEKILRFTGACGTYLGKLAKSNAVRISKRKVHGGTAIWTIKPPQQTNAEN